MTTPADAPVTATAAPSARATSAATGTPPRGSPTINASDGTVLPTGVQLGMGVRPSAVSIQGSMRPTS